ncbi:MAG: hypothetical protein JWM55_1691 [Acidimicrobiaceae bacterium]|nr:hypothetical protein [Acidimicrobiaceae bacterium]
MNLAGRASTPNCNSERREKLHVLNVPGFTSNRYTVMTPKKKSSTRFPVQKHRERLRSRGLHSVQI